ncbi:Nse4 C-terminal-domain-containing protein [Dichotomocladium elegans]|nr:Nse4 C-terminal-domain-containing protein [Dichotomocladium elegans]
MSDGEQTANSIAEEQDEGLVTLRKALNEKTDRQAYDPWQNKNERRQIRTMYRSLYDRTDKKRRTIVQGSNAGLEETIDKINEVFARVRNTQEAALDSRVFMLSADLGAQKAQNMRLGSTLFDQDEFVSKVRTLGGAQSADETGILDWAAIGKRAGSHTHRVQSMDFMFGPLVVEKKLRKVTRQVRIIKDHSDLAQPTQLQEGDLASQENETSANVNQIYRILAECGPVNLLKFVTNPDSFSQTVENIFYVSFLIRNAVAAIDDSSGQPLLSVCDPPSAAELAEHRGKNQIIIPMDIDLWREIIATYRLEKTIIPTRPRPESISSGKWY